MTVRVVPHDGGFRVVDDVRHMASISWRTKETAELYIGYFTKEFVNSARLNGLGMQAKSYRMMYAQIHPLLLMKELED